jgi:RimJ/RimL family protein N-acetyltransferase
MTLSLGTARLQLRPLADEDALFIVELLNEPAFIRNIGDRQVRTIDDALHYIDIGPRASLLKHGYGLLRVALREGDVPIGICGLINRDTLPAVDLGFAFLAAHHGKGYAVEAARAVMEHARAALGIDRVLAITLPSNAGSIRVLDTIGFRDVGTVQLGSNPEVLRLFESLP